MNSYVQFFIDYDRNAREGGEQKLARMMMSLAGETGELYVDFYVTPADADDLPSDWRAGYEPPAFKGGPVSRVLGVQPLSAYVCARVTTADEVVEIWRRYSYSSPKMYRIGHSAETAEAAALRGQLVEQFQWTRLEELSGLLDRSVCVMRDFHDEVGVEVLCLESLAPRAVHLVNIYLDAQVTSA